MKITLLKAFPDPYRKSMDLYAEQLEKTMRPFLRRADELEAYFPAGMGLSPQAVRYFSQYFLYALQVSRKKSDVYHIVDHSYSHLVHHLPRKPVVVTFHDAIWLKTNHGVYHSEFPKSQPWIKQFNLSGLKKAAAILCDSEASRKALLETIDYPQEKAHVVPLGVDAKSFAPQPHFRDIHHLGHGPLLLHVGHTGSYKNIPALFEILALLTQRGSHAKLVKVGTPFTAEQKNLIQKLGLASSIIHLGPLETQALGAAYYAADVLLLPSFDEGFGFPALEAMACGLPVICSNRGSLPEITGNAAVLLDPTDYSGFADSIQHILTDEVYRKQKQDAGHRQACLFEWENTAKETLNVYRKILER